MTTLASRLRFRSFASFRARVFWTIVPIVLAVLVFQGWINVREHRRLVTEEFEKRGLALASNLGFASELGALSEDRELLTVAIRGTLKNPDVAYVIIRAMDGRILASGGRPITTVSERVEPPAAQATFRHAQLAGDRFIEFVSPIVSEQSPTPDEVLIGARVRSAAGEPSARMIGGVTLGLSLASVEAQIRGLAWLWGGITAFFLGVSAVVIYGFSRRITNPVKELTRQAQKIAAGRLDEQIAVNSRDEIGQLASAFNRMTASLQVTMNDKERALGDLRELNRTLEDRIRQRTLELEERSAELEAASRHKSDFLANVSHELRTPMNAILGFNELILDRVYGEIPEAIRRPLTDIQQSGKHLLRLINDVLDLSKIEAGRMPLVLGEYSVADTIAAVRASLGSLAFEKGLEFVTTVPNDLPMAYGDGKRITQCLMNLAGNALKFTRRGRVEVAVELAGGALRFSVSDTGIGIPKDQIGRLFTEFQQADATITREFGGTGLGLSITRKFVEMHGGRVWVESEEGRGSHFFFSIPLRLEGPAP